MKTKLIKLPGGGRLLYTPLKEIEGVKILFQFKAGSFNDEKSKFGTAHFAEHILAGFPTRTMTKEERFAKWKKFQMFNASTSREEMKFYCSTVASHFDEAMDFITEPFEEIIITEEDFERERQVVLDEIKTRVARNQREYNYIWTTQYLKEEHFNKVVESPAGTVETVERITISDIRNFIDRYFSLQNLILVVTGNITQKQLMRAVKKFVIPRLKEKGEIGFTQREILTDVWTKPRGIYKKAVEEKKALITFNYPIRFVPYSGNIKDKDYRYGIISAYLREQMFAKLRLDKGLCYTCYSDIYAPVRKELVEDYVELAEENLDKVIEQYLEYLKSLPADMDKESFEIIKQNIIETENFDFEKLDAINSRTLNFYDNFSLLYDKNVRNYRINQIKKMTYDEVNALYKTMYKQKPFIVIIANDEKYADKKFIDNLYKKIKKIKPW